MVQFSTGANSGNQNIIPTCYVESWHEAKAQCLSNMTQHLLMLELDVQNLKNAISRLEASTTGNYFFEMVGSTTYWISTS